MTKTTHTIFVGGLPRAWGEPCESVWQVMTSEEFRAYIAEEFSGEIPQPDSVKKLLLIPDLAGYGVSYSEGILTFVGFTAVGPLSFATFHFACSEMDDLVSMERLGLQEAEQSLHDHCAEHGWD